MMNVSSVNPVPRISLATALFNPFHYLAGGPALGLGVLGILLAGVVGFFTRTHFDGVLDFHSGQAAPLWIFLAEGLVDWLALGVPLYLAGRLLSRSHPRALDVLGTQALARAPYLMVALLTLLPGFQRMAVLLVEQAPKLVTANGAAPDLSPLMKNPVDFYVFIVVIILGLIMLVWMVALMFRAYAVSCNLKGVRAAVSFIVALLIGEVISKVAIIQLFTAAR